MAINLMTVLSERSFGPKGSKGAKCNKCWLLKCNKGSTRNSLSGLNMLRFLTWFYSVCF